MRISDWSSDVCSSDLFFNFAAYFIFPLHVAATIGKGTIDASFLDLYVIFGALAGAIAWNLITWNFGLPSSPSHALIGGLVGAGICNGGIHAPTWCGLLKKVAFIVISPLLGFWLGLFFMLVVMRSLFCSSQRGWKNVG